MLEEHMELEWVVVVVRRPRERERKRVRRHDAQQSVRAVVHSREVQELSTLQGLGMDTHRVEVNGLQDLDIQSLVDTQPM
jgi:hypothetical protein